MTNVTYKSIVKVQVYSDNKFVGAIYEEDGKFRYYPKNSKDGGAAFDTLDECKKSIEAL